MFFHSSLEICCLRCSPLTKPRGIPLRVTAETSMPFPSPTFPRGLTFALTSTLHQFLSSNWKSEQGSPSNYRLVNSFSRDSRDRVGSLNRFTRDQSCREPIIHIYIYPRFVTILESPKRAEATRTIELITSFRLNEPRLTVHAKETSPLPSSLAHFPLPRFFNFFPGNFGRKPDSRD